MLKLIIEDDEGKTTVVPLIRDEISIGRKEGNTIRLTERNISRRHARLLRRNGEVFLEDLDSYNGIRVNGSKVRGQVTVAEGDRIQIGDYLLALKQDQPAAQTPSDPFDEMKTVPVEKAEAQAMASHLAALAHQPATSVPAPPAMPSPAPAVAPPGAQPQRDLIEKAAQAASQETPAKMVVVSSNYAGLECVLDKAAQVIGRTDDNDVVIDHRSVSKHHAKIVREGAAYSIVDLGSSNGIFVNGEKYDRVELRPGDMVDLGHVRMRFVGAGETWVFDLSAAVQTGPDGKKSNASVFIGVGLVLAIAAGVGILFGTGVIGGSKKAGSPQATAEETKAATDADPPRPQVHTPDHKALEEAIAQRDWKSAIRRADDSLLKSPDDADARRLRQKSIEEQKNEGHSSKFFDSLQAGLWERAVFEGSQVSSDSVYHPDVSKRLQEVKDKFKLQLKTEATRLHQTGNCVALKELAQKMQTVSPEDTTIAELVRSCRPKEPVLVADGMHMDPPRDPPAHMAPMDPPVRPMERPVQPPMDRPPPMEADGPSAEQLLSNAQAAMMSNNFRGAMAMAMQSIRQKPTPRAWAVYGAAACRAGDKNAARRAYKSLRGGQRNILVTVCKGSNIELP